MKSSKHAIKTKKHFWTHASQLEVEITYRGKLISSINRARSHRNGIWNDPVCLVLLSSYGSIFFNVNDYEAKNKMHFDVKYEWENMAAASISTLMWTKSHSRWELGKWLMSSATMSQILTMPFISGKSYWVSVKICALFSGVPYLWIFFIIFKADFGGCILCAPVPCSPEIRVWQSLLIFLWVKQRKRDGSCSCLWVQQSALQWWQLLYRMSMA